MELIKRSPILSTALLAISTLLFTPATLAQSGGCTDGTWTDHGGTTLGDNLNIFGNATAEQQENQKLFFDAFAEIVEGDKKRKKEDAENTEKEEEGEKEDVNTDEGHQPFFDRLLTWLGLNKEKAGPTTTSEDDQPEETDQPVPEVFKSAMRNAIAGRIVSLGPSDFNIASLQLAPAAQRNHASGDMNIRIGDLQRVTLTAPDNARSCAVAIPMKVQRKNGRRANLVILTDGKRSVLMRRQVMAKHFLSQ